MPSSDQAPYPRGEPHQAGDPSLPPAHRTRWSGPLRCGRCRISSSESPPSWRRPSHETSPGGAGHSSPAGVGTGGLRWGEESHCPPPISRHPSPRLNLTLSFGLRTSHLHPPWHFLEKAKVPTGHWGRVRTGASFPGSEGGRPGSPWPLTLDPAAPAFRQGGLLSLWGRGTPLSFLRAPAGEGLGFGGSPQEVRSPLRGPGPSRASLAGPRPRRSPLLPPHLPETWWPPRRCPRGSALRAPRPPAGTSPAVQPRAEQGRGSGRPRPSFPFAFDGWVGGGWRGEGEALAPPWPRLCSCAPNRGGRRGSAPGGGARRPRDGEAARPLRSVTCPHAARGPRLHVPRGGGAASSGRGGCARPRPLELLVPQLLALSPSPGIRR